ncbi:nucleolar pre-ribosomal-associated protein 1 [Brienomyrus brachyistius]|uniref:nucleolar pre-ribosomal-associated protein 1 n=1 Tax=Brienomyrus brachyistius TaxID=42636 RepID=UPI0020B42A82|nr:nucleolar pre-ribosomal-associated protein 1 [Brienomyrus brachyistius]
MLVDLVPHPPLNINVMEKKRAKKDSGESETQQKKMKMMTLNDNDTEFNGTVFKSMLKDPTKALKGLGKFVSVAKKLPSADLYDVVEGYIKISMECAEIFSLLEGEKHHERELLLIFQSLEVILLRTASDLSHFSVVGITVVKKMVTNHMKLLQSSLNSENHRFVRQCLGLLSSMVSQGSDLTREVFSHFHFNKSLSKLARRRDKKGQPDVRMAYIQFALSFLVSGDGSTIGYVLEMQDFLTDILSTGLKEDRISIINLILSTLQTRVIWNKAISKTQKVRFFSPAVLAQIASLYKWDGIADVRLEDSKVGENPEEDGKMVVRELVHKFLIDLCCSRKHGISFYDASLGTAGRVGNVVLLQFLVGLKQATEDELVRDLVVSILRDNPDLLSRYFKETQYSYTPRLRSTWQENVTLLKKIYEAQPEVSQAFRTREFVPLPRLLAMVMVTSLPPVCNKAFFTQALNMANTVVKHTALSLLSFILRRAQKNIEHCLDRAVWQRSELYTPAMMEDFVQQYREALSKVLPDVNSIISNWQSLAKKEKGEDVVKSGSQDKSKEEPALELLKHGFDDPEATVLKALILRVLCLYQKVVPFLISQSSFDFSKLLKGIMSEKEVKVPPVLQHQILQLALDLPANKFSWFQVQDVPDAGKAAGEKSVFYLLLKMFVDSSIGALKDSTRLLIVKVLRDSGMFEYTWRELELWLDHLDRLPRTQQEAVVRFLEAVLVRLTSSPYSYTDKAASVVQDAASLQASLGAQEGDAASIPISHIDDALDMMDVMLEGPEGEVEQLGPSLTDDLILQTFPFSALVPAALETRNSLPPASAEERGVVLAYLAAVLSDVLHCQRDPLPLCLALQQYDKLVSGSPHPAVLDFHSYYSRWLPPQAKEKLFKSAPASHPDEWGPDGTFVEAMKKAFCDGPDAWLRNSFADSLKEALLSLGMAEFPVAAKQILLYLKTSVETFSEKSKDAVLGCLLKVLGALVERLQAMEATADTADTEATADTADTEATADTADTEATADTADTEATADTADTEATPDAVAMDSVGESDLFLETDEAARQRVDKNQVLLCVLQSILKHPTLQSWFLALELGSLPAHSLDAVRVKLVCKQLTKGVLALLVRCGPTLRDLGSLELMAGYLEAVRGALLRELNRKARKSVLQASWPLKGLLALYGYMEAAGLKEVLSSLLLLPPERLLASKGEGAELSAYGQAAVSILSEGAGDCAALLSQAHLRALAFLLASSPRGSVADLLQGVLCREPQAAALLPGDLLLRCLDWGDPAGLAIGTAMLRGCAAHRLRFELWCLEPANLERLSGAVESFLPLLNTYLTAASSDEPTRPKGVHTAVLQSLKAVLLPGLVESVLSNAACDSLPACTEALSNLVRQTTKETELADLIHRLPGVLERAAGCERWKLVSSISNMLAGSPEQLASWRKTLLSSALQWLIATFRSAKEREEDEEEAAMLLRVQELLTSAEQLILPDWNSFIKAGLKHRYRSSAFLETLNSLLGLVYGADDVPADLLALPTLHMMITSHSLFLPSMLDEQHAPGGGSSVKELLVSLLLTVVQKCPSVCHSSHFVVLLGAYGATLSTTDQRILLLLRQYEKIGVSLAQSQFLLWGPAAVEHHKACKSLGPSLWQQPSGEDLLALLEPDRMLSTVAHYPLNRRIIPSEAKELIYREEGAGDLGRLYDPCFLLPLFSMLLKPESVVNCHKFVSSHALGVTVAALSSYDAKVRAAAYQVLGSFYHHLEAGRFAGKRQLLYLMDTVRNGIRQENLRVPFLLTTYVDKVAQQMLKPEEHMYLVINRFLLAHQDLDLKRVPAFFRFFYSFDLEHKAEREWLLVVLREGMKDRYCYEVCEQQGIFQVLLGFCANPICDDATRVLILDVLQKAAHVTKAAYELIKIHGLLTWILQLVETRCLDGRLLCTAVDLVHRLWFTNLGQKESPVPEGGQPAKCLPLPLIGEFLCVMLALVRHLHGTVKTPQLFRFLEALASIFRHRGRALGVCRAAGWVTVHEQPLPCTAALVLLHCWASLSRNAPLRSDLQGVLERCKVKELLGIAKERGRSKGHLQRGRPRVEQTAEEEEGEGAGVEQERAALSDCDPLLRDIFVHVSVLPPEDGDPNAAVLAADVARLLLRWMLRSLVAGSADPDAISRFLCWVQASVLQCESSVAAALAEEAVKWDFLRLYHRACEPPPTSQDPARLETLGLFTDVMVRLLQVRGVPEGDLHRTVLSACLSTDEDDASRREAGLLLLSLYVRELWAGADPPGLFLCHVQLVAGLQQQGLRRRSVTQAPVTSLCRRISSAAASGL